MLNHHTVTTLRALKLAGMATAFEEQQSQSATQSLSFEERFGLLVDRECTYRATNGWSDCSRLPDSSMAAHVWKISITAPTADSTRVAWRRWGVVIGFEASIIY